MEGLELKIKLAADAGRLDLTLEPVEIREPGPSEVVIRLEAAPIHPTDMATMFGLMDPERTEFFGSDHGPRIELFLPEKWRRRMQQRAGQVWGAGSEGAGVVVQAGADPAAQALLGKRVAVWGGGMYSQFRTLAAADCLVLHPRVTAAQGAACFVNPLTALGMVETMRRENHAGLCHTAAASSLGQMLNRLCLKDGVPLVNVVRRADQAKLLLDAGAGHVCDSSAPTFMEDLTAALHATGVTLAFDAVGGGRLAHQILSAMPGGYSGSESDFDGHKQVYLYGALDTGPTEIYRGYSASWAVGSWIVFHFLHRIGAQERDRLRRRVADEIDTTFATQYSKRIPFTAMLSEAAVTEYTKRSTGEKYLIEFGES